MTDLVVFDLVYYGDKDVPADHLHAAGMCDHTEGCEPATADQRATFPRCGQCVNRVEQLGLEVVSQPSLEPCPHCWMVGPCDC